MADQPSFGMAAWKANVRSPELMGEQRELFPLKIDAILPEMPRGAHLEFVADVGGSRYYCKKDKNGTPIRATEWFASSLARELRIPVPDFAEVVNERTGETFFGSKGAWGTALDFEVKTFLMTPQFYDPAIGGKRPFLPSFLSGLYAFDLFISNPDRQLCNFLLVQNSGYRSLLVFDFASASLADLATLNFPVAQSQTLLVGRLLRDTHRFFDRDGAVGMLDSIEAVPASVVQDIMASIPDEWLSESEKGKISGLWTDGTVGSRLAALRNGIEDESLL